MRSTRRGLLDPLLRASSGRRWVVSAFVFLGSVAILSGLVMISTKSPLFSVSAIGMALVLAAMAWLGLERSGTAILVLAMFFAPMNSVRPSSAVSFVTAADLLFVAGFFILLPVIVFRRLAPPPYFVVGAAILLTAGLFASLASVDVGLSLNAMARLSVAALGLPVAFMLWHPGRRTVTALAAAYISGQVMSVAFAVANGAAPQTGRYEGLATHVNFFGLGALLAVSLVPFVASTISPGYRWMPWMASLICMYGIWISGSRAALLVVVLVAAVYPVFERSGRAALLLGFAGAGAIVAAGRLAETGGENAFSRLLGGSTSEVSDSARQDLLESAISSFREHPLLGTGFANALEAHNIYLEVAVAAGIFGAFGHLLILWSAVRPMFVLPKPFQKLAYPALAYVMVGLITNSLWDRFIWAALSLSLIAHLVAAAEESQSAGSMPWTETLTDARGPKMGVGA